MEQLSKTYIIVFSILYSVTTHSYSKIFNTKISKWVWGTFDISTRIQLNITHTLVIHWLCAPVAKRPSIYIYISVITVHM